MPQSKDVTHNTIKGFITFFLLRHPVTSLLNLHESTKCVPKAIAIVPMMTWIHVTITPMLGSNKSIKLIAKEGIIIAKIVAR